MAGVLRTQGHPLWSCTQIYVDQLVSSYGSWRDIGAAEGANPSISCQTSKLQPQSW